ncbi:hypothetical protein JB92DRAFT_3091955 [Gautieria morchelliformis]|nr:hypothetical protein JB92DRAFT_3091955 [Gautieria morchelliformis]
MAPSKPARATASSGRDDSPEEILDLDEDNHGFSSGINWAHFEQAAAPFWDMDSAFADSSLGHFLKRSSADLGMQKVQRSCEQIQHLGERRDVDAYVQPDEVEGHDAAKGRAARVEAGAEVGVGIGIGFELDLVQVRILYV